MRFPSLDQVKERKVGRWALAYLAGAWLVLQVVTVLGGTYAWPALLLRAVPVVLGVGFFATLIVAWYHGERGAQRVSGTEFAILTTLLAIAGLGVMLVGDGGGAEARTVEPAEASPVAVLDDAPPDEASIAVLPFVNMSSDPEQEFFSDGITEELLNVLAQLPDLRVAARTSAFAFKGAEVPIDSIGRALNVRHVLEGSVRKAGDRIRITAQLINAGTGYHVWSETYDRELRDVFAIQDEISRMIVDQLQVELSGREGPLAAEQTADPEAHTLVLRARKAVMDGTGDPADWLGEGERLYERALARDSAYAAAWAGLANVHRLQVIYGLVPGAGDGARAEAEQALALDPDEGDAHVVLGALAMMRGDWEAGGRHIEQALEANPGDARTLSFYSVWLRGQGRREEALRALRRAAELDPLNADVLTNTAELHMSLGGLERAEELLERALALIPDDPNAMSPLSMVKVLRGERAEALRLADRLLELAPDAPEFVQRAAWAYAYARDFDRAAEQFRRLLALDPDNAVYMAQLANLLVVMGEEREALQLAERAAELAPENEGVKTYTAFVHAAAGRREAAERALASLPDDDFTVRAAVRAALGDRDRAFALLDRAVEAKEPGIEQMGADWWFDDLREDPRWPRLLARVGVPDVSSGG